MDQQSSHRQQTDSRAKNEFQKSPQPSKKTDSLKSHFRSASRKVHLLTGSVLLLIIGLLLSSMGTTLVRGITAALSIHQSSGVAIAPHNSFLA